MKITKAREIINALANGVNPTTGEVLPRSRVYNTPEVIRALYTIIGRNCTQTQLRNQGSS